MPGILFFWAAAASGVGLDLAADLLEEGDWAGCRRECVRVLQEDPGSERGALLGAVSLLRLGRGGEDALAILAESARDVEVRAMAAYELGRAQWKAGDPLEAARNLKEAFLSTSNHDLFLRAGCTLELLRRSFPMIGKNDPALFQSLETSRALWTWELMRECAVERPKAGGALSKPGQWVVSFYRAQISPAIAARCSLHPSCSEYFRQSSARHGLLGFPLIADRFVREPSVVVLQERPFAMDGKMRYADPVSDHTWWWTKDGVE